MLLLLLSSLVVSGFAIIQVNPNTQRFEDEQGRERFFHGTNIVQKAFLPLVPAHPSTTAPATSPTTRPPWRCSREEWGGLNLVRLGTMWPGIAPTRGLFNSSYVEKIRELVEQAGERGIFTLADMHQDVFNRKEGVRGGREGFPDWAVTVEEPFWKFPLPIA